MGMLSSAVGGIMNEMKIEKSYKMLPVSSGFSVYDYHNAMRVEAPTQNPKLNDGLETIVGGLCNGNVMSITGFTGSGKTTLAVQMSVNDCLKFELNGDAHVYHIDLENAFSEDRAMQVTGQERDVINTVYTRVNPMPIEQIFTFAKKIINAKKELKKKYSVENENGEITMPPTYIIIDTTSSLRMESNMERDEMGSMMFDPGMQAKMNNKFYADMAQMCYDVNITIINVNHIRDKIDTGPIKKANRVQHMGADENCPGGTGAQQYSDVWIRLQPNEKLIEGKTYNVHGKMIKVRVVKSRVSPDGREFHMFYSTSEGFIDELSSLEYFRHNKLLKGAGAHQYFETADGTVSKKFALKNFRKLYWTDAEFQDIAVTCFSEAFEKLVPELNTDGYGDVENDDYDDE